MKIYDTHSDIFYNLAFREDADPFGKYHLNDLKKGEVVGGIWVVYSDFDFDVIEKYKKALKDFEPYKKDFDVILGLEGLRNVKTIEELDTLYKMGIRHAMLTWNEENHLATGAKSNPEHGLKEMGKEFIKYMNDHNMIIDVSHLNELSFYEVLKENPKILIASHSNCYSLCPHVRALKDEQLVELKKHNGMVGVVAARNFVSKNKEEQTCDGLVKHILHLKEIIGINNIMLGLDMMNYLDDFNDDNLNDLKTHADCQNLVEAMKRANLTMDEIEKICYKNYLRLKERVNVYEN